MTKPNAEQLSKRIEQVVQEHLEATHIEAEAALKRAFGCVPAVRRAVNTTPKAERRSRVELAALSERLFAAVSGQPGELIAVLSSAVGATARELERPMMLLKQQGRVRGVGQRPVVRYFPMVPSTRQAVS